MYFVRVVGLVFCPILLCYFGALGVYHHVRYLSGFGASVGSKPLIIASVLAAGALVLAMFWGIALEIRFRVKRVSGPGAQAAAG